MEHDNQKRRIRGPEAHVFVLLKSYTNFLARIRKASGPGLSPDRDLDIDECQSWLALACETLHSPFWQFYRSYLVYDGVWRSLTQARHRLCFIAEPDDLAPIALDIKSDLLYLQASEPSIQVNEVVNEVGALANELAERSHRDAPTTNGYRRVLYKYSLIGGELRQDHWHKVNLTRERLRRTAILLTIFLFVSIFLVPLSVSDDSALNHFAVASILLFGLIGGLLSAVQQRETISSSDMYSKYYLEQLPLYFRPIIGSAAGLAICFLHISGIVTVAGAGAGANEWPIGLFVLAFVGGFSERFLSKQIGTFLSAPSQEDKNKQVKNTPSQEERAK